VGGNAEKVKREHIARGNETRSSNPSMLANLLFCGHCGNVMGMSFAKKNNKRYRYYVCQHAKKSGYEECPVKSVPAGEIERVVMDEVKKALQRPDLIGATFSRIKINETSEIERLTAEKGRVEEELEVIRTNANRLINGKLQNAFVQEELARMEAQAKELGRQLAETQTELESLTASPTTETDLITELANLEPVWDELFPKEKQRVINLLFERIALYEDALEITLKTDCEKAQNIRIPIRIRRNAGKKKIILPRGYTDNTQDNPEMNKSLAIAVALGHRWLKLLMDGRFNSVGELAEEIGVDASQLRRYLNLTNIKPEEVMAIMEGEEMQEAKGIWLKS